MRRLLAGATVYVSPFEAPLRDGFVLIEDGVIAAVGGRELALGKEATIDCAGLSVTAGFWNSHVHFFERKWADAAALPAAELQAQLHEAFTRHGFTSVFDLSSDRANTRALRARIESGEVIGPRVLTTGEGLVAPGALPSDVVLRMMGVLRTTHHEVTTPAEAAAGARELLASGVDGVKLFLPLGDELIRAAVDEAHRAGKPVFAHPSSTADVQAALRCGVDVAGHTTPHSGAWDSLSGIRGALTPTLTLWRFHARHERQSAQDKIREASLAQLRAWVAAGGAVLFGTDLGAVDSDPSEELRAMASAGLSFAQILASLTTAPAALFGGTGRIEPGAPADLVLLRGDPAQDLGALARVHATIRAGRLAS